MSLVIASILSLIAIKAVASMARSQKMTQAISEHGSLEDAFHSILSVDIVHAQRYRNTETGLVLQTHSLINAKTLDVQHLDSTVTYEVKTIGGQSCLFRTQQTSLGSQATQWVASGIRAIHLLGSSPTNAFSPYSAMPATATVKLEMDNQKASAQLSFELRPEK